MEDNGWWCTSYGGEWKTTNNDGMGYVGGEYKFVKIPKNVKCDALVENLFKSLKIDRSRPTLTLTCQPQSSMATKVVSISDDDDVDCYAFLCQRFIILP